MKSKEKNFKFDLQLFAESDSGQENAEVQNENAKIDSPENQKSVKEKNEEIEQLKAQISELTSIIEEFKTKRKSENKPDAKSENEDADPISEIEKLKAELARKDLIYQTEKMLLKEGFGEFAESLLPIVMKDDTKTTQKNIKTLKTVIEKLTQAKIADLKKGTGIKGTGVESMDYLENEVEKILNFEKTETVKFEDFWK